jgi:hypothetical protein
VVYISSIFVGQPETPILRQKLPHVSPETPNNLQETCQVLQEHENNLKMTEYSWIELSTDKEAHEKEAHEHLVDHFCKQGATEKDPFKPTRPVLLTILQNYMVIAGALKITKIDEGIPFFVRRSETSQISEETGNRHLSNVTQETDEVQRETANGQRETYDKTAVNDDVLTQMTPSQEANANAKRAKLAYERRTRIAQEKTQEGAQEVQRVAQDAIMES